MSTHTPGPWEAIENNVYAPGHRVVEFTHEGEKKHTRAGLIALVYGTYDISDAQIPSGEIDANARLIAAAPELLDALKSQADYLANLAKQFKGYQYDAFRQEIRGRGHSVRKAIASAEVKP